MNHSVAQYKRHRLPAEIIQHAVWLHYRFNLGHRDIEDLLARRGVLVIHEAIRLWCNKFGTRYAGRLRRGQQRYLWRAADQDGEVVDVSGPQRSH